MCGTKCSDYSSRRKVSFRERLSAVSCFSGDSDEATGEEAFSAACLPPDDAVCHPCHSGDDTSHSKSPLKGVAPNNSFALTVLRAKPNNPDSLQHVNFWRSEGVPCCGNGTMNNLGEIDNIELDDDCKKDSPNPGCFSLGILKRTGRRKKPKSSEDTRPVDTIPQRSSKEPEMQLLSDCNDLAQARSHDAGAGTSASSAVDVNPCYPPRIPARRSVAPITPPIPPRLPLNRANKGRDLSDCISELLQENVPWYWGGLDINRAIALLEGRPDGCFLVRDSASLHNLFSASLRVQGSTIHCRIECSNCDFKLMNNDFVGADSLVNLIERMISNANKGYNYFLQIKTPGVAPKPVKMQSYVSRFEVLPSLKYLSRFAIRQRVNPTSLLDQLDLPPSLLEYLKLDPFYEEELYENILAHSSNSGEQSSSSGA